MSKLDNLKAQYKRLGEEIESLEMQTSDVILPSMAISLKICAAPMTWQEAMDYAERNGMRLPTKFELQAIAESTDEFNHMGYTWSASTRSDSTSLAWYVYLNDGFTNYFNKTNSISVLCVAAP